MKSTTTRELLIQNSNSIRSKPLANINYMFSVFCFLLHDILNGNMNSRALCGCQRPAYGCVPMYLQVLLLHEECDEDVSLSCLP